MERKSTAITTPCSSKQKMHLPLHPDKHHLQYSTQPPTLAAYAHKVLRGVYSVIDAVLRGTIVNRTKYC